jgi:hypothetical protein
MYDFGYYFCNLGYADQSGSPMSKIAKPTHTFYALSVRVNRSAIGSLNSGDFKWVQGVYCIGLVLKGEAFYYTSRSRKRPRKLSKFWPVVNVCSGSAGEEAFEKAWEVVNEVGMDAPSYIPFIRGLPAEGSGRSRFPLFEVTASDNSGAHRLAKSALLEWLENRANLKKLEGFDGALTEDFCWVEGTQLEVEICKEDD